MNENPESSFVTPYISTPEVSRKVPVTPTKIVENPNFLNDSSRRSYKSAIAQIKYSLEKKKKSIYNSKLGYRGSFQTSLLHFVSIS